MLVPLSLFLYIVAFRRRSMNLQVRGRGDSLKSSCQIANITTSNELRSSSKSSIRPSSASVFVVVVSLCK